MDLENASLKRALAETEKATTTRSQPVELVTDRSGDSNASDSILNELWKLLPASDARQASGLIERDSQKLKSQIVSPSVDLDFEALRKLYQSPVSPSKSSTYDDANAIVQRVKWMLEDGQVLVERVIRAGKERETLKSNAVRAQRLVEESQSSLSTYQR